MVVDDPIEDKLEEDAPWRGVGGEYTVHLAPGRASLSPESTPGLEVLRASVGPLTRWWLGVASAWSIGAEPGFEASEALIEALDRSVRLPSPRIGWSL